MRKLLKILGFVFLGILVIIIILSMILLFKTKRWRDAFESNIQNDVVITSVSESNDILEQRVEEYIMSEESIDFIEFTPKEISQYLFNILTQMTEESPINLLEIYIEPADGIWSVCSMLRLSNFDRLTPWVCMDVTKDSMQTAQLYVESVTVDGIDVDKVYPSILTQINQGIAEALVTANENGFVGRILENIELQERGLIVKGSMY
jgi:hypothetical protein